jgi:uncharacterized protein
MSCRAVAIALLVFSFALPAGAAPSEAEVEEAYKKGQADWDRGDPVSAMPKLKLAADGGHPAAQALYGYVLDQADNDAEAAEYYRKGAEQNNPDALYGLAAFTVSGDGDVAKDLKLAKDLFARAGEQGHVASISVLVLAYINGGLGLSDEERAGADAVYWFKKGAEIKYTPALERLIDANRNGKLGLALNNEEADRLQAKLQEITGFDPANVKKKRQRR